MVKRHSERIFDVLVILLLVMAGLVCLIPMLHVIAVSLNYALR